MAKRKELEKYIMTVLGQGFEREAYVYKDRPVGGNDFIGTREEFEIIKSRLETDINSYQIYKLLPIKGG